MNDNESDNNQTTTTTTPERDDDTKAETEKDEENFVDKENQLTKINRLEIESKYLKLLRSEKKNDIQQTLLNSLSLFISQYGQQQGQQDQLEQEQEESVKIDPSSSYIHKILLQFNDSEDQYQKAFAKHTQNLNDFIDLHDDLLLQQESNFHKQISRMRKDFMEERTYQEKIHEEETKATLLKEIQNIQSKYSSQTQIMKREHSHLIQEIKNKNLEHINTLRIQLESKIEDLQELYDFNRMEFIQKTEGVYSDYQNLQKLDKQYKKEIKSQENLLQHYFLTYGSKPLMEQQNQQQQISDQKAEQIKERKMNVMNEYTKLKQKMSLFRQEQLSSLTLLSTQAHSITHELQNKLDLAQRILKMNRLNQKMEKEYEYLSPFMDTNNNIISTSSTSKDDIDDILNPKSIDDRANRMVQKYKESKMTKNNDGEMKTLYHSEFFEPFMEKYNKALLELMTIEHQEQKEKEKKTLLKKQIQQFNNGISINDEVLGNKDGNPLFVVNGRINVGARLPVKS